MIFYKLTFININYIFIILINNIKDLCHFYVGVITDNKKDTNGFNHDMPVICLNCIKDKI